MLKLIGKIIWKIITYFIVTVIIALIAGILFTPIASAIVFLIFILGSVFAIKEELMSQDIPEYKIKRKEKKLLNDSGKEFGMYRDVDMENMGFDSMIMSNHVQTQENSICVNCGMQVDLTAKFCPNCGTKMRV